MPCQIGSARLQGELLAHWPDQTYNAGCYNPNSWMDGTGPGTGKPGVPSAHQRGEAIDIGIQIPYRGHASVGQEIFLWLHDHRAALSIVQLIYSEQIWSATNQPESIRSYTANPHFDHIHVQLTPAAARNGSLSAGFGDGPVPPPPPEDDHMAKTFALSDNGQPQEYYWDGTFALPVDEPEKQVYVDMGVVKETTAQKMPQAMLAAAYQRAVKLGLI